MKTSNRAQNLRGSPTIEASEKVRKLLAQKKDVVRFDIGEPDFDTPSHITEAGIEALKKGFTHYTSARGILELREALALDLKKKGLEANIDQVVFYPGSKFSLYSVFSILVDPGDEVLLQDPLWPTYPSIVEYLGGKPIQVNDWNEDNPKEFDLDSFIKKIGPKTKVVLINSPCNPTGAIVPNSDISKILQVCDSKGIPLILDRIYSSICYDGEEDKIPGYDLESGNLIIVSGFSKEFAMTGWRLGYTVASKSFARLLVDFQENTTSCPSSFVQKAAVVALTSPRDWQVAMNREYRERRDLMVNEIGKIPGWKCAAPQGAFYCFARIDSSDSKSYASELLEHKLVSTIAGAFFGPGGEGHLRFAYTTSKKRISEGMERIREFVEERRRKKEIVA